MFEAIESANLLDNWYGSKSLCLYAVNWLESNPIYLFLLPFCVFCLGMFKGNMHDMIDHRHHILESDPNPMSLGSSSTEMNFPLLITTFQNLDFNL